MIQRTKIALIMPYFGNFPNYFALWECSASKNRDIDFLVFTNYPRENSYKNIIYIQCEFHEIKKRIEREIGFPPMLTNAYKIVDYKPLYGCIFHEYLKDYFNIWFEMLKKHPTAYIQATLNGRFK